MFYAMHKIVSDPEHGVFDKAAAERLWNAQHEMIDITGNTMHEPELWPSPTRLWPRR
jgi:tetrahydromethanopterin S-methyltransferase subunit H